jgi:phosphoglycerol transferase MdoB-like AlkP superfamily enzyme
MKKASYKKHFIQRISKTAVVFNALATAMMVWMIAELLLVLYSHYFDGIIAITLSRIAQEVIFIGCLGWLFFLTAPLHNTKIHRISVPLVSFLFLIFGVLSTFYYIIAFEPISSALLHFSVEEMTRIADDYFIFEWYQLLCLLPILIFLILFFYPVRFLRHLQLYFMLGALALLFVPKPKLSHRAGEFATNKQLYFIQSLFQSNDHFALTDVGKAIQLYQTSYPKRKFTDERYPLLHVKPSSNNLGPFFNVAPTPPNLVFLIVESLSSPYSGNLAEELSFTPFLDSLAATSLYFPNFLATGERTFAALPAILASLPHGNKGFTAMNGHYPNFTSFPEQLFHHGYTGRFFYGGHANFDNMGGFMRHIGFSSIVDREEYNYEGTGYVTSKDPVPFGVGDRELLLNSFQEFSSKNTPYLHVYLTLSMHYPYIIDEPDYYLNMCKQRILQNTQKGSAKQRKLLKYQKELATFLYTDDALRRFFQQYSRRADFDQTIFVIVGDHMMGEIAQKDHLEKYRVPCLIYSPLLKKSAVLPAVNSHLDLAPALSLLFEQHYQFILPDQVHWLGADLDTTASFVNQRTLLFMRNKRATEDLISNQNYISETSIFKLNPNGLFLTQFQPENTTYMQELLGAFRLLHSYVCEQDKIYPTNFLTAPILLTQQWKGTDLITKDEFITFEKVKVDQRYKSLLITINIQLDIDFDVFTATEQPLLILSFTRPQNEEQAHIDYLSFSLRDMALKTKNGKTSITINKRWWNTDFRFEAGDELSIYLWNKKLLPLNYPIINQHIQVEGIIN